ncbi:hypothetical protein ACFFHJ_22330 [Planotetraspora thailandica]|uniref:hypothetical protein n=1 Tax=Planotetraspora thailandica TaxID=487172 RepID=UPI00194DE8F3|nr:hypothetical protein [Planotetraspora thailandica]
MSGFAFRIKTVYPDFDGFEGHLLAGPVLKRDGNLSIGDLLTVPTATGHAIGRCAGFPLIRWDEHRHWVGVVVATIRADAVQVGSIAESVSESPSGSAG